MPTYEYLCEKCGNKFDVVQKMTDPRLESCPDDACGGKVKRLIGAGAGLIFKGSGFYITDYRSDSYKSAAKADSGASSSGGSDSKSSGDAKPKSESKPASGSSSGGSGSGSSKPASSSGS